MVKCWICNQEMEGVGYNDDNFIWHLAAEHVKIEFDNSGTQVKIGASKKDEMQTL